MRFLQGITAIVALGLGQFAVADLVSFTGATGDLEARATFATSGSDLIVTLTNTSLNDVMAPDDVLTAVFFDMDTTADLTPTSAILGGDSIVLWGTTDPGNSVGGEWAYRDDLTGAPFDAQYGISSAGFNLFGPGDRFPGNDLFNPEAPNGLNYGITSAGDDINTGNQKVTGSQPLIQNEVVFTLSGLGGSFDPAASITNVTFQYGTNLSAPQARAVPLPPAAFAGLALFGLVFARKRRSAE